VIERAPQRDTISGILAMNAQPSEFVVELPLYSGPFRLLADLILDQKIDVCDVPLAKITDRFVHGGVEAMRDWPLEEATWFLALCAVLIELKVGRLLPRAPANGEEDLLGGVSPDLLYARSRELAAFRRVAEELAARMEAAALLHPRTAGPPEALAHLYPDPLASVSPDVLRSAAAVALSPPALVDLSHVMPIRVTLTDALHSLTSQLALTPEARFRDLLGGCEDRIEVVVRFLAILELYREGKVELSQSELFGDIEVRWRGEAPS
jgi:segregation and condensation protein A